VTKNPSKRIHTSFHADSFTLFETDKDEEKSYLKQSLDFGEVSLIEKDSFRNFNFSTNESFFFIVLILFSYKFFIVNSSFQVHSTIII
jgi:hypothetical protein